MNIFLVLNKNHRKYQFTYGIFRHVYYAIFNQCNKFSFESFPNSKLFDVTMGAYDGVEVYELVGIFILHHLSRVYNNNNIGLCRDDGLAVFKNISGPQAEKIKKHFP